MKLPHTTKVAVRKALKAIHSLENTAGQSRYALERTGVQVVDLQTPKATTQIARKAGFHNRTDLEHFARKHRLL